MSDTTTRERADVLADLAQVAAALTATQQDEAGLYAQRTALLQEGRALVPPVTQRELAKTAGVSEEAIVQVLRKQAFIDAHGAGEHSEPVAKCPRCKANGTT